MLAIFRLVIFLFLFCLICIFGCIYCLFVPKVYRNITYITKVIGKFSIIFGIKSIIRIDPKSSKCVSAVYICNHQNNYDFIFASSLIKRNMVIVGKKSLIFIPFFGQLYWLSGNFFIDRRNSFKSMKTLYKIIDKIKKKKISVWIFPEGTRNRGKELLPFKFGAFYIAILSGVPIIPVCFSRTEGKIKLNRWNNKFIIVEVMSPICTENYKVKDTRKLVQLCFNLMRKKISELDLEIKNIEKRDFKI